MRTKLFIEIVTHGVRVDLMGGELRLRLEDDRVRLSGQAVTVLHGELLA